MANFSTNFDPNKFMRDLEAGIRDSIEEEIRSHPEKVLDDHIGERITGKCTNCDCTEIEVLPNGRGRCSNCGLVTKMKLDVTWR